MEEQKSFKERVRDTVISNASSYKRYYVDYEYLLCSKAFVKNQYYIISAYEDNYLHLTGLHTDLDATTFFEKSYNGTLTEMDFDFYKCGQTEGEVKGSVRRKINSLKGNDLNTAKAKKLDVVLRRKVEEKKFSELLLGDEKSLQEYKECLYDVLSEELQAKIADEN